jgi:hypothetical protein
MSRMGLFFCSTLVLCFAAVPANAEWRDTMRSIDKPQRRHSNNSSTYCKYDDDYQSHCQHNNGH